MVGFIPVAAFRPMMSMPQMDSVDQGRLSAAIRADDEDKPCCAGNVSDRRVGESLEICKADFSNLHLWLGRSIDAIDFTAARILRTDGCFIVTPDSEVG
jgi:hypothetical protein